MTDGGEGGIRTEATERRTVSPSLEADQKQLRQASAKKKTPDEKKVVSEDGGGSVGDLTGYVPSGETGGYRRYTGTRCNPTNKAHLSGGIDDDRVWHTRWWALAVMPTRRYNVPRRIVGHHFVHVLAVLLTRVWQRRWNSERFIVFQTVILQCNRHVTGSGTIWRRINHRLDYWEAGDFEMMAEDTALNCAHYLFTSRGEDTRIIRRRSTTVW